MKLFLRFIQWILVGLTIALLVPALAYKAYLSVTLLSVAIALIIPGSTSLFPSLSILQSPISRWILWFCLLIATIVTFASASDKQKASFSNSEQPPFTIHQKERETFRS